MKRLTAVVTFFNFFVTSIVQKSLCLFIIVAGCEIGSCCAAPEPEMVPVVSCCNSVCEYEVIPEPIQKPVSTRCQINFPQDFDIIDGCYAVETEENRAIAILEDRFERKQNSREIAKSIENRPFSYISNLNLIKQSRSQGVHFTIPTTVLRI